VPGIQECPDVRLVAVCDVVPELARKAAAELGVEAHTDHRELLARADLEAVVIVTATPYHAPLATDALNAGKHVLLEKPLARTSEEAVLLARLSGERGLVGAVGYQNRFRPQIRWLHEQARRLKPVQVLINRPRGMMAPKYLHPEPEFGIMDYISHDLDLALWLMDDTPTAVTAVLQRGLYSETGAIENVSVLIEFGTETERRVVTLMSTMGDGGLATRYEVIGRHGCAGISGSEAVLTGQVPAPDKPTGYRAEVERLTVEDGRSAAVTAAMHGAFASAVRVGDTRFLATLVDGAAAMSLHESLIESDLLRNRVPVRPLAMMVE
jgi:predicted dehydrogenase